MFTELDQGCYIDGAFGLSHAAKRMADMVEPFDVAVAEEIRYIDDMIRDLALSATPDDTMTELYLDELIDDATDILNQHTDGVHFVWDSGDLILTVEEI